MPTQQPQQGLQQGLQQGPLAQPLRQEEEEEGEEGLPGEAMQASPLLCLGQVKTVTHPLAGP